MVEILFATSTLLIFSALTEGIPAADPIRLCPNAQQGRSYVFECSGATASNERFIYWQGNKDNQSFEIGRCYFEDTLCSVDDHDKFNITNLPNGREFKSLLTFRKVSELDQGLIINCSVWDIDNADDKEVVDACRLTLFKPGDKSVYLVKPETQFVCSSGTEISYPINCSANMFATYPEISLYVDDVRQKDAVSRSWTELKDGQTFYWRTALFNLTLTQSDQGKAIRCEANEKLPNSSPITDQFDLYLPQFMRLPYFTNSSGDIQEKVMTLERRETVTIECHSPFSNIYITCSGREAKSGTHSWNRTDDSASLTLNGDTTMRSSLCICQASYRGQCANTTAYLIISYETSSDKNAPHFAKWTPLYFVLAAVICLIFLTIFWGASVFLCRHWKEVCTFFKRSERGHYEYIDPKHGDGHDYQDPALDGTGKYHQRVSSESSDTGVFHSNFPAPPIDSREPKVGWETKLGGSDDSQIRCVSFHQDGPTQPPKRHSTRTKLEDNRMYVEPVDEYEMHIRPESSRKVSINSADRCPMGETLDYPSSHSNDLSLGPDPSRDSELTYTNCFSDVSTDYNEMEENAYIEPSSLTSSMNEVNRAEEEYLINLLKLDGEA